MFMLNILVAENIVAWQQLGLITIVFVFEKHIPHTTL